MTALKRLRRAYRRLMDQAAVNRDLRNVATRLINAPRPTEEGHRG